MSMFMNIIRVKPATFERIKRESQVLDKVLFDEDAATMKSLEIEQGDVDGFDYLLALDLLEADDDDEDAVFNSLGTDESLAYDAGYECTAVLSPTAVKQSLNSPVLAIDSDVKKVFVAAAERGDYIIATLS